MKYLYTVDKKLFGEIKYSENLFSDYKKHFHDTLGFSFVEKGKSTLIYNIDTQIILKNTSVAVFNPNQLHCTQNINALGYYTLDLDIDWCKCIQSKIFSKNQLFIPIDQYMLDDSQLQILIKEIFHDKIKINYEEKLRNIIENIFIQYCRKKSNTLLTNNLFLVNKMKEYIYNNLDEKLSLNEISQYLGYDKSYLIRVFKKEVGVTPQNFIINEKVHKVKKSITIDKNLTLSDLAHNTGFYDQSHLNKNFKKVFASTPQDYKNI